MNGNVTKEGITKDLEWMNRVGIGGMQMFEASLGTPRIVANPIVFNTPAWKETIQHTAKEATRLGLEWTLSAAGGWSETGGPMVKPAEAMKKLVWSETTVKGGQQFAGKLTRPSGKNGRFLDAASGNQSPTFYKDAIVMAYRLPDDEVNMLELHPKISSSSVIKPDIITDGKFGVSEEIMVNPAIGAAWVQFEFGQHYTRNNTWAEQSVAWNTYLARCSYLLQQGKPTSDIAYFIGEDAPSVAPFWEQLNPEIPEGYKYDFVNTDVIIHRMHVENGEIVLPDGVRYKLLVLPAKLKSMSVPLLKKIQELVAAGATIVGPKPVTSPGLINYPDADLVVEKISTAVWRSGNGGSITLNGYRKGKVYWGKPIAVVMQSQGITSDMAYTKPAFNTQLNFIQRRLGNADIYFVANQQFQKEQVELRFRVEGKVPELWYPDRGITAPVSYRMENGCTIVPVALDPYGSVFVIFREIAHATSKQITAPKVLNTQIIGGSWDLHFPPLFKNTTSIRLDSLQSWSTLIDSTLQYFSGTASYTKTFQLPAISARKRYWIDLGAVKEIAELTINGKSLGILWETPYSLEVTNYLRTGANKVEIKVTNLWTNWMQGDKHLPVDQRFTFATNTIFGNSMESPELQLIPSGLLGPVTIITTTQ